MGVLVEESFSESMFQRHVSEKAFVPFIVKCNLIFQAHFWGPLFTLATDAASGFTAELATLTVRAGVFFFTGIRGREGGRGRSSVLPVFIMSGSGCISPGTSWLCH